MRRGRWLLLAFWVAPALVATLGMYLVPSRLRPDLSMTEVLGIQLALWLTWGLWSLLIFAIGDRFPFERGRVVRALAVHLPLCAVVVLAQMLVVAGVARTAGLSESMPLASTLRIGLRQFGDLFTVVFWGIVVAHGALRWSAAYREQQLRTLRLDQDLAEAQLRALQAQLRPHFLFNALNSVVAMIDRDAPAAQRMVIQLADLLRATLRAGEQQQITLQQEIELTRLYLEIEQVRFSDRLTVDWKVSAPLDAKVPALALQPLVENALVHGVSQRSAPGRVCIEVVRDGESLLVRVSDDGPGLSNAPSRHDGGVGLANLRARLQRLYHDKAELELVRESEGSTVVRMKLPIG